jgi:hypothetical protein
VPDVGKALCSCSVGSIDSYILFTSVSSSSLAFANPTTLPGITNFVQLFTDKYYTSSEVKTVKYIYISLVLKVYRRKVFNF